jgi:glycosyltransferase involved in cell wall biosynthesis
MRRGQFLSGAAECFVLLEKARRVLIIVENLPVPFDRRVWQEATALKEAGYGVTVICPKGRGHDLSEETIDGIHIYRHSLPLEASGAAGYLVEYSAALFWETVLSIKVLRRHGFDIIHACNPPDLIFLVALFHKLFFGKKFLFDQHDINPELYEVKFGRKGLFHRLLGFFEGCTFKVADGSIATSEALKDRAVARWGVNPEKTWVVRSFPDLGKFKRTEPDLALKSRFRHLAGYVGIMAEQDGVEYLVRGMDHIVHRLGRSDIGCVIIGNGPDYERLKKLSADLGLDDNVIFAGYLSGDALMATLSVCDIGVIPDEPNVCNDKLSMNKVFEYMALGLPFVQFDLTQARIDGARAGRIVRETTAEALGEAMVSLIDDAPSRERMSAYGMERAKSTCQWDLEKERLLEAYRVILSDPVARPAASLDGKVHDVPTRS